MIRTWTGDGKCGNRICPVRFKLFEGNRIIHRLPIKSRLDNESGLARAPVGRVVVFGGEVWIYIEAVSCGVASLIGQRYRSDAVGEQGLALSLVTSFVVPDGRCVRRSGPVDAIDTTIRVIAGNIDHIDTGNLELGVLISVCGPVGSDTVD